MISPDPQRETMRIYRTLTGIREDWGGGLVLCCGPGCAQTGAPVAAGIAGGATLAIDSDATAMKSAMRAGYLDFVVNTLDEALRTLKNEVRQRRPLGVGLIADVDAALNEMVGRGVLPDLLLIGSRQPAQSVLEDRSIRRFKSQGMTVRLVLDPDDELPDESTTILSRQRSREVHLVAGNAAELKVLDDRLLAILPPEDSVRQRWLQRVPKYLREARTGGRWIWLSEEEVARICS